MSEINRYDLEDVEWREYEFVVTDDSSLPPRTRNYRIERPIAFFWKPGATTHRVLDITGTVHIVPAPGHQGCVMRYQKTEGAAPVKF